MQISRGRTGAGCACCIGVEDCFKMAVREGALDRQPRYLPQMTLETAKC
jgi:hypothetical protein